MHCKVSVDRGVVLNRFDSNHTKNATLSELGLEGFAFADWSAEVETNSMSRPRSINAPVFQRGTRKFLNILLLPLALQIRVPGLLGFLSVEPRIVFPTEPRPILSHDGSFVPKHYKICFFITSPDSCRFSFGTEYAVSDFTNIALDALSREVLGCPSVVAL